MTDGAQMKTGMDVKEGDDVFVVLSSNLNCGMTLEERTRKAVVTKVSRVWLELKAEPYGREGLPRWPREWRMRRDTQAEGRTQFPHNNARFYTPEQYENMLKERAADKFLSSQGIRIEMNSPWRGREVELAEILRAGMMDGDFA